MYNGIGLQTARGSGTSGYIQANFSLNQKKTHSKQQFLQELEQKRKANMAPSRKANSEIVEHERKRQIMIQSMKLRAKLVAQGFSPEQVEEKVKKGEEILQRKFEKGEIQTKGRDTHVVTQAKQKQYVRLSDAFGLKKDHKQGSAFDFHGQRQERLKRQAVKQQKRGYRCEHEECGKKYDTKEHLERHLKYKHPSKKQ